MPVLEHAMNGMEKFRIAQYGCIQMVALAYGLLSSGLVMKAATFFNPPAPPIFGVAKAYHDYGFFLSLVIIAWATFCAYRCSTFSKSMIGERSIVISGLILSGLFFLSSSYFFVWGLDALFYPTPSLISASR
jgi:hypothetical protein